MAKKQNPRKRSRLIIIFLAMFVFCSCSSGINQDRSVDFNENEVLNPVDNKAKSGGIERFEPKFTETLLPTETPVESQPPVHTATPTKAPTLTATARATKTLAPTKPKSPTPTETALPELTVFVCPEGCTEQKPGCNIKGNISVNSKEKIYHMPGQQNYEQTVISPEYGER